LCHGTKFYDYEVGERGWMPFTCPTCKGERTIPAENGERETCFTCHGGAWIDPANPPLAEGTPGLLRKIWMIFFGG
jgi:hypothetical protein